MPTVTLALRSQRKKPIPDEIRFISIRGLRSGEVQSSDIEIRPNGEVVLDLVPDQYTIYIEPAGFVSSRARLKVGFAPIVSVVQIESLVTRLPSFDELLDEQARLLASLDPSKDGADLWDSLPDNKAATFFQVTH